MPDSQKMISNKTGMKKVRLLIVSIISMFILTPVKAEILDLPDFNNGKTHWRIGVGVIFNGVAGSGKGTQKALWEDDKMDGSYPTQTGFNISIGFVKSYAKSPLYGGLDLEFGSSGYNMKATKFSDTGKYEGSIGTGGSYSNTIETNNLEMYAIRLSPTILGYKYKINRMLAVDAHFGAYVSYNVAGKYKYEYNRDVHYYYDNSNKNTHNESETKISDVENLRKLDAGLKLGVGFFAGHFNIDFSWNRGFIPMWGHGDDTIKIGKETYKVGNLYQNSFLLSLGYTFK